MFSERLNQAGVTTHLEGKYARTVSGFSGILVGPVGTLLRPSRGNISAALLSLRKLHIAGLVHRDSRWPNAIMVGGGTCLWLDLRTLEEHEHDEEDDDFAEDVSTFVDSFHASVNLEDLKALAIEYLHDDNYHAALLAKVAAIWR